MPAGDAQRVWFPEMVAWLRSQWHEGLAINALIALRDDLDTMLGNIRSGRNIRSPVVTCLRCGATGPEPAPHVSVGAMILALARFGIAAKTSTRALERDWATYRTQHGAGSVRKGDRSDTGWPRAMCASGRLMSRSLSLQEAPSPGKIPAVQ